MTLTILIIIYILSFLRMYFWNRNAHSKGGIFEGLKPDKDDLFFTVVPFVNTCISIIATMDSATGKESKPIDLSKFFNIKK